MATFATNLLFCFATLAVLSISTEATGNQNQGLGHKAKRVRPNLFLMKLYMKWSKQTKNEKIPFNASAVCALHFTSIQKTSSNSMNMTYKGVLRKAVTVMYDELHLYIKKSATAPPTQIFTIHVKDGLTNKMITSYTIDLQTTGWYIIPMHLKLQDWYNSGRTANSLNAEMYENVIQNGSPAYPSIGTTSFMEEPFVIVYYR